jgi:hypothetical protein
LQSASRDHDPTQLSIFFDCVIEPEGYGFDLNSSMKFAKRTFTSAWRVNSLCFETTKIGESALALIAKAAFDTKPRHRSSRFAAMVAG